MAKVLTYVFIILFIIGIAIVLIYDIIVGGWGFVIPAIGSIVLVTLFWIAIAYVTQKWNK